MSIVIIFSTTTHINSVTFKLTNEHYIEYINSKRNKLFEKRAWVQNIYNIISNSIYKIILFEFKIYNKINIQNKKKFIE